MIGAPVCWAFMEENVRAGIVLKSAAASRIRHVDMFSVAVLNWLAVAVWLTV